MKFLETFRDVKSDVDQGSISLILYFIVLEENIGFEVVNGLINDVCVFGFSAKMEAVVSDIVAPEDLKKFEKKYNAELVKGPVSRDTTFEYAWCLIRSKYTNDIVKGIQLLEELVHTSKKDDQRDFLFYLAVANYRLKEYERALKYIRTLLKNEPDNKQALELEKLIKDALKKDGLVGMAIVGGIGLGVAGLAGLIGLAVSKGAKS